MVLTRYLSFIFLLRIILLCFLFSSITFLFESFTAKNFSWHHSMIRVPFVLHKSLPFIIFIGSLLFFWRLIRFGEGEAIASSGISLARFIKAPLMITFLLGLFDLLVIAPWGHSLINPFKAQKTKISLHTGGWERKDVDKEYLLVKKNGDILDILSFSSDSSFKQHCRASSAFFNHNVLLLKNGWCLSPGTFPSQFSKKVVPWPVHRKGKNQHPSLMSFLDVFKALRYASPQKNLLAFRRDYLLSNALWLVSLVIFSASLMIGRTSALRHLLYVVMGTLACFTLYLIKEWLYALSLSLSYMWHPLALWTIPLLTLALSILVLVEKKEF